MEAANLAPLPLAKVVAMYEQEITVLQAALDAYIAEPCSATIKRYTYHRDFAEELMDELERRIIHNAGSLSIQDVLTLFKVPHYTANGLTYIHS